MLLAQNAAGIASLELDIETGNVIGSEKFWDLWGLTPRQSAHISVLENIVIPQDKDIRSNPETRKSGTAAPSVEYRIKRPDNGQLRWLARHIEFTRDETGHPLKMFGVMQDITERKEAEAHQKLLTHELEHRIKNILAMVSAIASQTLRNSDLETASASFNERLRALAAAHDILTRTRWTEASIADVINSTISIFPVKQISVSGPSLSISPKMALSLALAVNELGTNSQKYGALSVPRATSTSTGRQTPLRKMARRNSSGRGANAGAPRSRLRRAAALARSSSIGCWLQISTDRCGSNTRPRALSAS